MRAEPAPTHITGGQIVRENLPFPIVHYPGEFGVFLAFAPSRRHIPKLCTCARPAVENFMKLRADLWEMVRLGIGWGRWFPEALERRVLAWDGRAHLPIEYAECACHQCNGVTPSQTYCAETQSSSFLRTHGWYVNQASLRLGILPQRCAYLPEVCPPVYQSEIETTRRLEQEFRDQCSLILDRLQDPLDQGFPITDSLRRADLTREDINRMMELRQCASTARRQLKKKIEAVATSNFEAQDQVYVRM